MTPKSSHPSHPIITWTVAAIALAGRRAGS